jgi:uncharacterized protein (TIRG00374 family)
MKVINRLWRPHFLIWVFVLPFLIVTLRSIPLGEIWAALSRLHLWQILVLAVINLGILLLFSSRWWLILRSRGYRLPYFTLVSYRLSGFGISYFTPGPQFGGEPLMVYLLRLNHNLPASAAIASVTLDRLLELMGNFSFIVVGLAVVILSGSLQGAAPYLALSLSLALLALPASYLLILYFGGYPLKSAEARFAHRLQHYSLTHPNAHKAVKSLVSAEEQISQLCRKQPFVLVSSLLLSLLIWVVVVAEYRLTVYFLGQPVDWITVISLLTAARIAFLLPVPGGLGTLEASQVFAMQALGLNPALGISVSLLIRARDLLLGGIGLWLGASLTQRKPLSSSPSQVGD